MKGSILTIAKNFVNLVYPLHCASCSAPLDPMDDLGVCASCRAKIRPNPRQYLISPGFDRAYSAFVYEGVLKELIHTFKYNRKISLSKLFAHLLIEFIKNDPGIIDNIDVITFVPLNHSRLRKREFNQSKILASKISDEFKKPLRDSLDKVGRTKNQNELSRKNRLVNLKGAFRVRAGADISGRSILLLDDVMTTGATLSECSRTLKDGGAKEVRCLTLARGA